MENKSEIVRSPAALNYQLVFFTITFFVLAVICIYVLIVPFRYFDGNATMWFMVFALTAILMYFIGVAALKKTWQSLRYYMSKDYLMVSSGFKGTREDVYRYENIVGISLQQTNTEKTRGYARIVLQIEGSPEPITLKDIVHPADVLSQLQQNVTIASKATSVK